MIEPDSWLLENAASLGVDPELVNPASVDVRLGGHIIAYPPPEPGVWRIGSEGQQQHGKLGQSFLFKPGWFYLAHTLETVTVPETHAAQLILKSSSGRKGLDHAHSGWLDPGFSGQVTYEFTAYRAVSFEIGQRIAQLVFMRLTTPPLRPYSATGHYMNQTGATEARDDL